MSTHEEHRTHRVGWLRAAVLGAHDGIVSTARLIIGVAAAETTQSAILLAGVVGLVADAMSMAAGEYVSVSSQADTEKTDLELEQRSLEENVDRSSRRRSNAESISPGEFLGRIGRGIDGRCRAAVRGCWVNWRSNRVMTADIARTHTTKPRGSANNGYRCSIILCI